MRAVMLRARWYDGRSSQPQPVLAWLEPGPEGPSLHWHPVGSATPHVRQGRHVGWPESFGTKRLPERITVDLREQGSLELDDAAGWFLAFAASGATHSLAERMQLRWRVFLAVLLVAGGALFAFYRWGTPWAATQLTRHVPLTWEWSLTERAMADLDGTLLKPSALPPARQQELRARFDALAQQVSPGMRRYPGYTPKLQLQFRSGLGANAFALPGGTIVLTDGLVQAAAKQSLPDDALVGVLAHEIGHVLHRHTTRIVVEQAVLNVGLGLATGDMGSVLSIAGSLLTGLAYRRSHETEADCFAAALMRQGKLPTQPMADLLLHLENPGAKPGDAPRTTGSGNGVLTLLSSHPDTHERALKLKQGVVEGCS